MSSPFRAVRWLALCLVALWAPAASAATPRVVSTGDGFMWKPALAGDRVYALRYVPVSDAREYELQVRRYRVTGGGDERFASVVPRGSGTGLCLPGPDFAGTVCGMTPASVAADATGAVAVGIWGVEWGATWLSGPFAVPRSFELFTSARGETPAKRFECPGGDQPRPLEPPPPQVAGGVAVAAVRDCVSDRVTAVDAATGAVRAEVAAGAPDVVRLAAAPGWLAFVAADARRNPRGPSSLVVVDLATGRPAYTVALPSIPIEIAVQADGTAAATLHRRGSAIPGCSEATGRYVAQWFSVAEPRAHTLPQTVCRPWMKLHGGRLAVYHRPRAGRQQLALVRLTDGTARAVAELDTTGMRDFETLLARLAPYARPSDSLVTRYSATTGTLLDALRVSRPGGFDWDGRRLAYFDVGCAGMRLAVLDTGAPGVAPAQRCSFVVGEPRVARNGRSFTLPLRCPKRCAGAVLARGAGADGEDLDLEPYRTFDIRRRTGAVKFTLDSGKARAGARFRRIPVDVVVAVGSTTRKVRRHLRLP